MKSKPLIVAAALLVIAFLGARLVLRPQTTVADTAALSRTAEAAPAEVPDSLVIADGEERETITTEAAGIAPPPPAEAKLEQRLKLLAPGVVEVWVLDERHDRPYVGATVFLVDSTGATRSGGPPEVSDGRKRRVRTVGPSPGDVAEPIRFEGLAKGGYHVGVARPGSASPGTPQRSLQSERWEFFRLTETMGVSIVLRLGSASVFGTVRDRPSNGRPLAGVPVTLSPLTERFFPSETQRKYPSEFRASVRTNSKLHVLTDERGDYAFSGLPSGGHQLMFDRHLHTPINGELTVQPSQILRFELEARESRRVDFPPSLQSGGARWRGRIVAENGAPIVTPPFGRRSAQIRVTAAQVPDEAYHRANGFGTGTLSPLTVEQRGQYALDGTFEIALPAGRYNVTFTSPHRAAEIDAIQDGGLELLPGRVLQRDLTLAGTTLQGQLPSMGRDLRPTERHSVTAHLSHNLRPDGFLRVAVDERGAFRFYGLGPGDWIVDVPHLRLTAQVTLPTGAAEATVDLQKKPEAK